MFDLRRAMRHPVLLLLVLALALTGCSDDDTDGTDAAATATDAAATATDPAPASEPGPAAADQDTRGVTVEGDPDTKPAITLPGGEPPAELVVVDLIEGDGEEVAAGATVTTHYVGVSWLNDGTEFDSSWDRGEPISFPLDGVIAGWTEGIPGMKVGGRRMLIIPPDMAYGAGPPSPDIAVDDTLVFVIDLVAVQ